MFFQAKDGIRNVAVTGVQTCALPISRRSRAHSEQSVAFASRMSSITSPIDVCSIRYSQPRSSQVLARSEERRVGKERKIRGRQVRSKEKRVAKRPRALGLLDTIACKS